MDAAHLTDWLSLYSFNTAFRLAAFNRALPLVEGDRQLSGFVKECLAADTMTRELEVQAQQQQRQVDTDANPEAVRLDRELDRLVSAIPAAAQSWLATVPLDGPEATAVQTFVDGLFPRGLNAVVHASFVEELSAVEQIATRLGAEKELVKKLSLGAHAARLTELAGQMRTALGKGRATREISSDKLRELRAAGQERLAQYVFLVVGKHSSASDADIAARRTLLRPVMELNDQLGRAMARNRGGSPENATPEPMPKPV